MTRSVFVAYPVEEDDIAEAITREDVTEGLRTVRGILTGIAASLAIWGLIIAGAIAIGVLYTAIVTVAWLAVTR